MGCSLTSRLAPLSCGAFPFLHPRRQRDELPAPSFTWDIPDPDRVGPPKMLQALVREGHVTLSDQPWGTGLWCGGAGPSPGLTVPPLPPVKFMREVTPYIKKPSLVSDLPWEGAAPQSPSLSGSEDSGSPQHQGPRDRKVIPLKMCFAARNLSMPDLENR